MKELLIPTVLMLIAVGFTYAGFKIAVQKKFDTMVSYYKDKRMYVNHRAFATRHGLIELAGGMIMLLGGIFSAYYKLARESLILAFCGSGIVLIALKLNKVFSKKNW